jgi:hypothetical protein
LFAPIRESPFILQPIAGIFIRAASITFGSDYRGPRVFFSKAASLDRIVAMSGVANAMHSLPFEGQRTLPK